MTRLLPGAFVATFAGVLGAALPDAAAGPAAVPVIDLHVDLPYRSFYKGKPFDEGLGEFRALDLRKAGVRGVLLPLFVPKDISPTGPRPSDLEDSYAATFEQIIETPPYSLPGCGVETPERPLSTWFAFEGAAPLEPTRASVASWMLRGVRSFGLIHSQHNALGTSSGQSVRRGQGGLTDRGRSLVKVIQAMGGIVDVSHASDESIDDVLAMAKEAHVPVIATHSNARALAAHPRNLTDAHLRGIAETGGVIGVNFHQRFLEPKSGSATIRHVVQQIRYIARVAGVEHVAIGSDFEGGIRPVAELSSASRFQNLAEALRAAGMKEAEIRKVFFENAWRVLCSP